MQTGLGHLEIVILVLLVLVAALAVLAKRLRVAYPIVMVLGGLGISLVPGIPRVSLDPNIVFLVILPPLLFSAAFHISWRDFRENLVSISMLAFGLVGFTIYGVAATTRVLLPGFDWKLGLVLGAVVATTDAIASTATAKRLGLPRRITDLLEAESLVNDGSGLVALKFTLPMVVTGVTPSFVFGVGTLLYLVFAATIVGLLIGVAVNWIQKRIVDPPVEITISLITPFLAYLTAEALQCSGVLATLACGIYLGRQSSGSYSLHARIEATAFWKTLDFILNGLVFLVLGLQLPAILSQIKGYGPGELVLYGALFSGVVILLRLLWVFPGAWISRRIQHRILRRQFENAPARSIFLVGWAGMRGVLALAAALSLPEHLESGAPFPERNLIIFLTFSVIFATLVVQGLSMPALIHRLGLAGGGVSHAEESRARREMVLAALNALRHLRAQVEDRQQREISDHLESYYRRRLGAVDHKEDDAERSADKIEYQRNVAQQLRDIERATALRLRDENKIHDEVLRRLEHELDLLDARFAESEQ